MRSIEEIVSDTLRRLDVSLIEFRGQRQSNRLKEARREALARVWQERPDLSSSQVAKYFHRDGSTIRDALARRGLYQ